MQYAVYVFIRLPAGRKLHDLFACAAAGERRADEGQFFYGKFFDLAAELFVEVLFDPGDIFARHADAGRRPFHAERGGDIEQKDGIAGAEAPLQRAQVVAVHDPAVCAEDGAERGVELSLGNVGAVGAVPEHIQVIQRQARGALQLAGKGTLARTRAADDDNFLHTIMNQILSYS